MNKKKYCSVVFLDVAQALLVNTHNILQFYLKDRKFRIKYNEYITRDYNIMAGVPKASPILNLILTVDLHTSVLTSAFADDTAFSQKSRHSFSETQ